MVRTIFSSKNDAAKYFDHLYRDRRPTMAKKKITFNIECGEKTCASEPGSFCKFFRNTASRDANCALFGKVFCGEDSWIHRHKDCIHLTGEDK